MENAPAKPLTKTQLISTLADKTQLTKTQIDDVLGNLAQLAYTEASKGFTIPGIGKLVVVDRKARYRGYCARQTKRHPCRTGTPQRAGHSLVGSNH